MTLVSTLVICMLLIAVAPAQATQLIANGGFESGFSGWTRVDQLGSEGTFALQSGTASPVNGFTVPAPPGGTRAAMTDALGPGSHVLYQDFLVPLSIGSATLTIDLYVRNSASNFFVPNPATLDFSTPTLNEQARVDIMSVVVNPFDVSSNVLLNLFQTLPGDPLVSGYTTHTSDLQALLAAHAGQTLRLRFAEVDNVFTFNLGVDNVGLTVNGTVPGAASLLLLGVGLATLGSYRWAMRPRKTIDREVRAQRTV